MTDSERAAAALRSLTIFPLRNSITPTEVVAACPDDRPIYVCDFYLQGAEQGDLEPGGLRLGRILNVDHHAAIPAMQAPVTSTQFAYAHLTASGGVINGDRASWVVINHTDCDSVLSSAMLIGHVPADRDLVRASICADHTGDEHPVADLLQALDEGRHGDRTESQYDESLRNLQLLLAGRALEPVAVEALRRRRDRATAARRLVESGGITRLGPVALGVLPAEIDGAFFPALLPEAMVIILASPHPNVPLHWSVKLRLGKAAPTGLTLHRLRVTDWDANFGGRWNAGSNKRGGGTPVAPQDYALAVAERVTLTLTALMHEHH